MRVLALISFLVFGALAFADLSPVVQSPPATLLSPNLVIPLTPNVAPTIAVSPTAKSIPLDTGSLPVASKSASLVASPAAPPNWAQEIMVAAEKLPVVGPFVTKVFLYLGIVASIMTVLVGTALTIINSLAGVFTASGLTNAAAVITKFRDGPIMYWLKFLSLFNAQKPKTDPPMPPPAVGS